VPLVTIQNSGATVEAQSGLTLLEALQKAGVAVTCTCDKGKYDPCHLFVVEGRKSLSKADRTENERIDGIVGAASKSRLACLARLGNEPVTVELLGALSG
jgi:2Fe-2S ferredoxin